MDMPIEIRRSTIKAVARVLRPLVRVLLRHDIAHSEFSELAKQAYVDMAYKHYRIPNRKQTYSRVSVLTGLSRKEVVRLSHSEQDHATVSKGPLNRAVRVISGWTRDPEFVDAQGKPKELPLRGDGGSFEQLVARYSGDITARAILDELTRVGAVTRVGDDKVKICHQAYIPEKSEEEKLDVLSTHAADLLTTGVHNLQQEGDANFQRQVTYVQIPQHAIAEFKQYSHARCLELLLEFDQWLAEKKQSAKSDADESLGRVGVGIYYFNHEEEGV